MEQRKKIEFNDYEVSILLEAIEDLLYKLAIELNHYKGGPMSSARQKIYKKQNSAEELQPRVSRLT